MTSVLPRYSRQISREEQMIYDHLLNFIDLETPEQMLERFRHLFIDGTRYAVPEISEALSTVATSATAKEDFRYVLNRCCHILINHWQAHPHHRLEIPRLIHLFETASEGSTLGYRRYRSNRRVIEMVKQFRQTEQYLVLRRFAQVLSRSTDETGRGNSPLGTLIRRYPFLYEHCLLGDDHNQEQQQTVRQVQYEVQHQFELDLSKYVTYQLRKAKLAKQPDRSPKQLIQPAQNPTLMSDGMLNCAIKHYAGQVSNGRTYRDIANNFLAQSAHAQTFRDFKDDLYQYILMGVDSEYSKRKFRNQLHSQLKLILPDSDLKPLNDFLMVRTCSQLFNFLVVDSPKNPQHYLFVDLLTNIGPISTTGLLLRILLLCSRVRPYLERRFSILFSHYESSTKEAVEWLVSALETLNVALTTNFGKLNLTTLKI